MTWNLRRFASVLLTVAVTSLFCIGLYTYNNKYTHDNLQPANGYLLVTEDALDSFHYLIHGWAFYPDALLTPEDMTGHLADHAGIYTSIGERTRFDGLGTRQNPHGCGSYALELELPMEPRFYMIEFPEIFSSYRLYINGEEYLHVGVPEPTQYEARTQTKLVPFRASGHVDLLLAVSDYSHYYSGMVYPPVFGIPDTVTQLHDFRQSVSLIAAALGLILMVTTLYLGIMLRKDNAILFALLSFALCLTIIFPYLHVLFELSLYPWYMLELLSIYLMPLLVVILHNRICEVSPRCSFWSIVMMSCFCLIACGYASGADILQVSIMQLFSKLAFIYKLGTAVYLLITAYLTVNSGQTAVRPIYYATIAYATIFLWDRILPVYEPIIFGWFMDWGNLLLVIAIGISLLRDLIASHTRNLAFAEEHRQMTKQLTMQQEYTRQIAAQNEKNRRMVHDFRHHLRTLSVFSEKLHVTEETKQNYDELCAYLNHVTDSSISLLHTTFPSFSDNPSVDALLQYYYHYAKQKNIDIDFRLMPAKLSLSDVEYCTLLGNLLENAIDACLRLPDSAVKRISLNSKETDLLLFIKLENTYDGVVIKENLLFSSRKSDQHLHGIGMASVRDIIERHGGTLDVYPMNDIFRIGISLPLKPAK